MASQDDVRAEIARLEAEARAYEEQANSLLNGEIDADEIGEETLSNDEPMEPQGTYQKRSYPPPPPPSDKRTIDLANNSAARCTAHKKNGEQCRKWAMYGTTVCGTHGGRAPQSRAKAMQRLADAAPQIAERLIGLAQNKLKDGTKVGAYAQVQAANSVLDRVGVTAPKDVTVTVKPFEAMLAEITSGSREDFRRQIGDDRAGEPPAFGELEHSAPNRPGDHGPRVIGTTFDGHEVIDAEVYDAEVYDPAHPASGDQGDTDDGASARTARAAHQRATETLANYAPTYPLPNGGYMPTEQAMEQAAEANRAAKRNLRRL